jgi:hypothetical protein
MSDHEQSFILSNEGSKIFLLIISKLVDECEDFHILPLQRIGETNNVER